MSREQEAAKTKRAKTMEQCRQRWDKVVNRTINFRENLGRGASFINQMIILNTAGAKLEEQIAVQASNPEEKHHFYLV